MNRFEVTLQDVKRECELWEASCELVPIFEQRNKRIETTRLQIKKNHGVALNIFSFAANKYVDFIRARKLPRDWELAEQEQGMEGEVYQDMAST